MLLRYSLSMKDWFKYLVAAVLGLTLIMFFPESEIAKNAIETGSVVFQNLGRYILIPFVFISFSSGIANLRRQNQGLPAIVLSLFWGILTSLALTATAGIIAWKIFPATFTSVSGLETIGSLGLVSFPEFITGIINTNALAFFTTPTGSRWDANIMEGAGGISMSTNWNTFWDVAVSQDENGWYAEFRVPFSSLRFQDENGQVTMGLISWRFIARKNERVIYPAIPDNWPVSFYKISRAQEITFDGIKRKNPVYISAFGVTGIAESQQLNQAQTKYLKTKDNNLEPGIDLHALATTGDWISKQLHRPNNSKAGVALLNT